MTNFLSIFRTFFTMGLVAFGGPAMHIALVEREIVGKKGWLKHDQFKEYIGLTSLIPGPNSTEMVMCCGLEKGGRLGVLAAGLGFIVPATAITFVLAWVYVEYGHLPELEGIYHGIQPAVIALVLVALSKLWKKTVNGQHDILIACIAFALCFTGLSEVMILLIMGGAMILYYLFTKSDKILSLIPLLALPSFLSAKGPFLIFFKVGAILYGSGYVLFAYLQDELVEPGLLSLSELMDAIAIGQFTPGPVLSTATFIGYQLDGPSGSILATIGIFLPSFLFVLFLHPFLHRLQKITWFKVFVATVSTAAIALMVYVIIEMGLAVANRHWIYLLLTAIYLLVFLKIKKAHPAFVIPIAGFIGWGLSHYL